MDRDEAIPVLLVVLEAVEPIKEGVLEQLLQAETIDHLPELVGVRCHEDGVLVGPHHDCSAFSHPSSSPLVVDSPGPAPGRFLGQD